MAKTFPDGRYVDVPGLCAVATLEQIEKQGWSLNPGRYVGVAAAEDDGIDFRVRLEELSEELEKLNTEAAVLQERIADQRRGVTGLSWQRIGPRSASPMSATGASTRETRRHRRILPVRRPLSNHPLDRRRRRTGARRYRGRTASCRRGRLVASLDARGAPQPRRRVHPDRARRS